MKNIVFRADDLGYCEGVNLGIIKCVKAGLIQNVGCMVNMEDAKAGLKQLEDCEIAIGLHCNISAGTPLCPKEDIPSLVDEHGGFHSSSTYADGNDRVVYEEAVKELTAQLAQFIAYTGKKPAYIDGHAVASQNFFLAIEAVARQSGCLYSPFPAPDQDRIKIGHSLVYVYAGSTGKQGPYDTFYQITEQIKEGETHMIVYHPGFLDAYLLDHSSLTTHRVYETRLLCDSEIHRYVKQQAITCLRYDQL